MVIQFFIKAIMYLRQTKLNSNIFTQFAKISHNISHFCLNKKERFFFNSNTVKLYTKEQLSSKDYIYNAQSIYIW